MVTQPKKREPGATDSEKRPAPTFPIVGIGASAGGLVAFEAFFSGMPPHIDPGMAFVLVQHLAPDHKSILTDLIRRYTPMKVFEVEDGMVVQPNCAYIIPPNHDMAFLNGTLQLLEPSAPRGHRLPIDFFFRSLAQDQRERAIGIILSGTGSDGTLGVRAIKGEGGMVMVQNPASTEYDGMPRSAIATGLVDYELPPAEMPAQLMAYVAHAFAGSTQPVLAPPVPPENALNKIFVVLRIQTGHDFSQYKPSTVNRRIERRMAVHQIETLEGYIKYLQKTPVEVELLFRDLLIGVTSFFRDPEAFEKLEEKIIPQLLNEKPENGIIRVWVPGCSTGEEAYSIAMLLKEQQEALKKFCKIQIFATDIDNLAIMTARKGIYPASIVDDILPARLARFFTAESHNTIYRIRKSVRDMVIFSEQDVIKDPPFSKLDLISCRNLLIYMGEELQKKLIPLFHYVLNPGGFLFLGTSETVGDFTDLFGVVDRKLKLYQRKENFHEAASSTRAQLSPSHMSGETTVFPESGKPRGPEKLSLRELTERSILRHLTSAGILVNAQGDILYLHGHTGLYLELAPGEAGTNNILKMAREGLAHELSVALRKSIANQIKVSIPNVQIKTNGSHITVNVTVCPVTPDGTALPDVVLYLILLEPMPYINLVLSSKGPASFQMKGSESYNQEDSSRIAELKQKLRIKEEHLQNTNEELETANEELTSSNEEMQSINEELQSTNEELETTKEELQSINEELSTVNSELQIKVADLSRLNNDMNNLFSGTGIGTVFVDYQLRILRFTPTITQILNLIFSDVGRPITHIVSNLVGYDQLSADVQAVLDSLIPKEIEVQTRNGIWYMLNIRPYRTLENVIEGAVITFIDITAYKLAEEARRRSETLLRATEKLTHTGSWEWDIEKQTLFWTEEMYHLCDLEPGKSESGVGDPLSRILEGYQPQDRLRLQSALEDCVAMGRPYDLELYFTTAKGRHLWVRTLAEPFLKNGKVNRIIGSVIDITEQKQQGRGITEQKADR